MRKNIVFMKDFVDFGWNMPIANVYAMDSVKTNVQTDYVEKLIEINQFMIGILKSEIPAIYPVPAHMCEYAEQLKIAQASALTWNSTINAHLLSVPKNCIENLNDLKDLFEKAICDVKSLQEDLTSEYVKKQLTNKIGQSKNGIENMIEEVQTLINKLKSFHSDMPAQAKALEQIASLMSEDSKTDVKKVKDLQDAIQNMNDEIKSLTGAIVGLGIADGAAFVLSGLALLAGPIGMLTWIFTGAAIAVATTVIVLNSIKISNLNETIHNKENEAGEYNTAIATLNEQANMYKDLANQILSLQESLSFMISEWRKIITGLDEIESEILTASNDYDKEDWESVGTDFEQAKQKCEAIIEPIKKLDISNLQGTDAKIEIGMTEEEIKRAMENAKTESIVDYIRKIG